MAYGRKALLAVLFGLFLSGWVYADKLVVFQNGRTLRVQAVRDEGAWLYLTLGERSEMGVLSRLIVTVNDIESLTDGKSVPVPNAQSAAGGPASRVRATASQRGRPPGARSGNTLQGGGAPGDAQAEAATRARSDALARAANRASTGRVGRVPPTGKGQEVPAEATGSDLAGGISNGGWRSLLDDSGRGRSTSSSTAQRTEENPKR